MVFCATRSETKRLLFTLFSRSGQRRVIGWPLAPLLDAKPSLQRQVLVPLRTLRLASNRRKGSSGWGWGGLKPLPACLGPPALLQPSVGRADDRIKALEETGELCFNSSRKGGFLSDSLFLWLTAHIVQKFLPITGLNLIPCCSSSGPSLCLGHFSSSLQSCLILGHCLDNP